MKTRAKTCETVQKSTGSGNYAPDIPHASGLRAGVGAAVWIGVGVGAGAAKPARSFEGTSSAGNGRSPHARTSSVALLIQRSPKRGAPNEHDLSRTLHLIKCREVDKKPSVALMRHESEPNPACDATKSISKPAFIAQRSSDAQSNRPAIAHLSIYWPRTPQIAQKRHAFAPDNADGRTRPNANRGRANSYSKNLAAPTGTHWRIRLTSSASSKSMP